MTALTALKNTNNDPLLPVERCRPAEGRGSGLRVIFAGPGGLRVGWRLLIFVVLLAAMLGSLMLITHGGMRGVREDHAKLAQTAPTALLLGGSEAIAFLILCVATLIMGRIERRKFGEYGLPLRQALGKDFRIGALTGFLTISGTLAAMYVLGGFRITGLALHGAAILSSLGGWAVAFLLVGLFEEFVCRGYVQYTLASAIGFWPAALVFSGLFGLGHAFNPNENAVGALATVLFALLLCLFLRRTGNLWCAVGYHAAYDWGQTLYGVPDSGMLPYHNVFSSAFSGPRWLTGGIVGPEASVLTPIALLIVALGFSYFHRQNRYLFQNPNKGDKNL